MGHQGSPTIHPENGTIQARGANTIGVLRNRDEDEQKCYHKFLGEQFNLTKDDDKVEMGRKGGLKTQENIRETNSQEKKVKN